MGGLDAKLIRRAVLGVMAVLGLGLLTARPGSAVVREPEAVVEGLVGHIIELLESGGLSGESAIQRLADTIAGDTDLDRLGRLVLGRHWRSASEHLVCEDGADGGVPIELQRGDIVAFSSLLPHATGPNMTQQIRKVYIASCVPDGTRLVDGTACDDPVTQPLLLDAQG